MDVGCVVRVCESLDLCHSLHRQTLTQTDAKRIAFKLTGALKSISNIYLFYCAAVAVHSEDDTK